MSNSNLKPTYQAVDFDPFAEGEVLITAPATASQKEIWASVQMGSEANCAYNESVSLRLSGELDLPALQESFQQLVQRHEAVRTTLSPDGNNLCINDLAEIDIQAINLSQLNPAEKQQQVDQVRQESVEKPFDLEHGPLFRVQILKLQPQSHLIILSAHHIICDGWSWAVLITDLGKLYSALKQGTTAELSTSDRFSDYALMLEESAGDAETIATEDYWVKQFSDSVPIVDFPTDRSRPPLRTFDSQREDWQISETLVTDLKQLGTKFGCSFMTTLLSGFEVFLHRLTGQDDLTVGISAAGQAATGNYNLVGHCVNLLPLRTQINSQESFRDYLQKRKTTILDAYDYQQFTFGSLLQKLALPRDSSRIPLVPIVFNIDQGLDPNTLDFDGLEVEFTSNPRAYENFEIFINATELKGKLTLECQYNTNLFDRETICRRLAEFETLLSNIVANPDETIATIGLLPEAEQQLLKQWNQTEANYSQDLCIHQLVEAQAAKTPDKIAVVFEDQQLTYKELDEKADVLATYLIGLGVKPEVRVGICVERSLSMIVGLLGILKAGGAYVPIDPTYPASRINFVLQDAQVALLITQESLIPELTQQATKMVCLDRDWETIATAAQDREETGLRPSKIEPDNLAYVIYTSGSTGKPKGVLVPHKNVTRLFAATQPWYNFDSQDVWTLFHSYAFDFAVWEIWGALLHGGRLVVVPYWVSRTPESFYDLLVQEKVTILNQTPSAFYQLIPVDELSSSRELNLRLVIFGGEALNLPSLKPWLDRHGDQTPQLVNMYGITETTVHVTYHPLSRDNINNSSSVIGRPIPDLQVSLLDQNLQQVPIGIAGEICIGGAGVARGYLNRPELTAQKFISDPVSKEPETRLYKSGDLARYLANGDLEYLGRIDNQVQVRGFRIELGEIEAAMSEYSAVKEAVAIVREDIPGEKTLVGYFVDNSTNDNGASQHIPELRKFLKERLPDYMIPMVFVVLDAMPQTSNGKIDRQALPQPDTSRPELAATYTPPRNDLEQEIANIWAEVMNLEQVGIYDNFFELGGYSLLGIKIIARLRQSLQIELLLPNLFELPTVADLATRIETLRWAAQSQSSSAEEVNEDYEEGEL